MKYVLTPSITVGDFSNQTVIDELEIQSASLCFDPQVPTLSVVLLHKPSGFQHVVTYRDSSAVEFWAKTFAGQFDFLAQALLQKLAADSKLPAGTIE